MLLGLIFTLAVSVDASPPSVHEFYVRAIAAMSGLPQPQYVTYRMVGQS